MFWRKTFCLFLLFAFALHTANAGILVTKSNGITLTGADGITLTGADGITLTGADGFLNYQANGITLTGADGITLTGADGITLTGADGANYVGANGITLTGADGITLTGADGITLTGADGITLTGADGATHRADSFVVRQPNGITLTGADGITLTGADGITLTGADGITLTGADGITLTGADGITLTGADSVVGFRADGNSFTLNHPNGITLTGADGITLTGVDGITLTGADGITLTGVDNSSNSQVQTGLQSLDPELAVLLNNITDDRSVNAVLVYHRYPTEADLNDLKRIGIVSGTRYRVLPFINVSATKNQLVAVSRLAAVRSIYGNRTLTFNSDPYFAMTGASRAAADADLTGRNQGFPVSGKNVTVAVLDTGVNALHNDLAGRVVQNVKLVDAQSGAVGFGSPLPVENLQNTDWAAGHGTFVAGIIAGSGAGSGGRYNGVAPGARILGLSAGDANLGYVLAGFDYLLDKGAAYNVRAVNCSFSANTVFDFNDPVNVATKMLTERGVSVVFSAGNTGPGNATLNPYAAAPWVISVGATDEKGRLAPFSSRGVFGSQQFSPSLAAPGVNVVSLRSAATQTSAMGAAAGADAQRLTPAELPFYTTASGTSFTAPQVAGVIALMLEVNPGLQPAQIKEILQRTATPLPPLYQHEAGAGMLNAHAAVLEAAFPIRKMGLFRAALDQRQVRFVTAQTQVFSGAATPGSPFQTNVVFPRDTVQTGIYVSWGGLLNSNDLALSVRDAAGNLRGESNYLNLPGLTGRSEKVVLSNPPEQAWRAVISHTAGAGTTQNFFGAVETTRVEYAALSDLNQLSTDWQTIVKEGLRTFTMLPDGKRFRPMAPVTRAEFASALLRGARVPQYLAGTPMFPDVRDLTTRGSVESAQSNPSGKLFYDAARGAMFRPDAATTKLVAAVALVKAAGLQNLTATASLTTADALAIPAEYRGYAAVALSKGLLAPEGANFAPQRSLTKIELTQAMVKMMRLSAE